MGCIPHDKAVVQRIVVGVESKVRLNENEWNWAAELIVLAISFLLFLWGVYL